MRIVCISDTHMFHKKLKLLEGDVLVHAGDALAYGTEQEALAFINWFGSLPYKHKIYVPGNHDFAFQKQSWLLAMMKATYRGVYPLVDQAVELEGVKFYGSPWVPNLEGWAFYGDRLTLIKRFNDIPQDTQVLVTHAPPQGICDETSKSHVGSSALWAAIVARPSIKYHIFGHIHEGYGVVKAGDLTFVNAASCDRGYRPVNEPIVVEVEL